MPIATEARDAILRHHPASHDVQRWVGSPNEVASGTVGFETGPSILVDDGTTLGWRVSTFAGFIVYPFSQATYFPGDPSLELGLMAKMPIPARGPEE
jgi:hypothetical protein